MAATVLTVEHYDSVRGLIAPDITEVHISDAYLSGDPFAPDAEREVRKRLLALEVDVDRLDGDALSNARLAMMHQCASELCLTAPQVVRQTQLQILTEVQAVDWEAKREYHLSKVEEKLADIVASVSAAAGVISEASGRGRRLPFGAVGVGRTEVGEPRYPYTRRVHSYND